MKKYISPRIELVAVESHALMASSVNKQLSIPVDSQEQVVSGCSNRESYSSIWEDSPYSKKRNSIWE